MHRRSALALATLTTLTALTACQGSPEAGRPNTAPPTPSVTPTPTPSAPSTPTPEQAAATAAKARYAAAQAAIDAAAATPTVNNRPALEKAGIGGTAVLDVVESLINLRADGWYQTGRVTIVSTAISSVKLNLQQPEVRLLSCLDSSSTVVRFQKNGKAVPLGPGNGNRHKFASRIVYAPAATGATKMWWLIENKAAGSC
jgi:hypothetical protein